MKKTLIFLLLISGLTLTACNASTPAPTTTPETAAPTTTVPAATDSAIETTKVYSLSEIAKHSTSEDCWLAINGKVYDVTGFGAKHPGEEAVYQGCGLDATTLFETRPMGSKTPHSAKAMSFLPNFYIGELAK